MALELLEAKLLKERFGVGARPRKNGDGPGAKKSKTTRHIPQEIKRAVFERDGMRCSYVDPQSGRRCVETERLEFQHHRAFGKGGAHTVDNLSLYCDAHNQMAARRDYGDAHIEAAVDAARRDRAAGGGALSVGAPARDTAALEMAGGLWGDQLQLFG